jgi:hypothetical protein
MPRNRRVQPASLSHTEPVAAFRVFGRQPLRTRENLYAFDATRRVSCPAALTVIARLVGNNKYFTS